MIITLRKSSGVLFISGNSNRMEQDWQDQKSNILLILPIPSESRELAVDGRCDNNSDTDNESPDDDG